MLRSRILSADRQQDSISPKLLVTIIKKQETKLVGHNLCIIQTRVTSHRADPEGESDVPGELIYQPSQPTSFRAEPVNVRSSKSLRGSYQLYMRGDAKTINSSTRWALLRRHLSAVLQRWVAVVARETVACNPSCNESHKLRGHAGWTHRRAGEWKHGLVLECNQRRGFCMIRHWEGGNDHYLG